MTVSPNPPPTPEHRRHDLMLVAGLAARELAGSDQVRAQALVEGCVDCRLLLADLAAIQRGLRTDLPTPRRSRDFRLTPTQAAAARRPSLRQRVSSLFGRLDRLATPLAGALVACGIVLVVLGGTASPGLFPAAGSASRPAQVESRVGSGAASAAPAASPPAQVAPGVGTASPVTPPEAPLAASAEPSAPASAAASSPTAAPPTAAAPPVVPLAGAVHRFATSPPDRNLVLAGLGLLLVLAGVALYAVRRARARRPLG